MKQVLLATCCIVALLSANVYSSEWDGGAGTDDWMDAANWVGDVLPTSNTYIRNSLPAVLYPNDSDTIGQLLVYGDEVGETATLTIQGTLNVNTLKNGNFQGGTGIITIDGGTVNMLTYANIGSSGVGRLIMNSGTINGCTNLSVPSAYGNTVDTQGILDLNGGTIYSAGIFMNSYGQINIGDGTIVLAGDQLIEVNGYVSNGWIVGTAGKTVDVSFDGAVTTISSYYDLNASPANGEIILASSNTELTWTNWDPNTPGDSVWVDVWFGTDPNKLNPAVYNKIVDAGENTVSVTVDTSTAGTYYWQIDSYRYGDPAVVDYSDPNNPVIEGHVFMFSSTDDAPPSVVAGSNIITWLQQETQLNATIDDDGSSALSITWTADDPNAVFSDTAIEDPTVTVGPAFEVPGTITLTVTVEDALNPPVSDSIDIFVYADACEAARVGRAQAADYPEDISGDCVINLEDFARMASIWLEDYALTEPYVISP